MSTDSNTKESEDLNADEKKTIKVPVRLDLVNEFLSKLNAPFPDASELDEIHLLIQK